MAQRHNERNEAQIEEQRERYKFKVEKMRQVVLEMKKNLGYNEKTAKRIKKY